MDMGVITHEGREVRFTWVLCDGQEKPMWVAGDLLRAAASFGHAPSCIPDMPAGHAVTLETGERVELIDEAAYDAWAAALKARVFGAHVQLERTFAFAGKPVRTFRDGSGTGWVCADDCCRAIDMSDAVARANMSLIRDEDMRRATLPGGETVTLVTADGMERWMAEWENGMYRAVPISQLGPEGRA